MVLPWCECYGITPCAPLTYSNGCGDIQHAWERKIIQKGQPLHVKCPILCGHPDRRSTYPQKKSLCTEVIADAEQVLHCCVPRLGHVCCALQCIHLSVCSINLLFCLLLVVGTCALHHSHCIHTLWCRTCTIGIYVHAGQRDPTSNAPQPSSPEAASVCQVSAMCCRLLVRGPCLTWTGRGQPGRLCRPH